MNRSERRAMARKRRAGSVADAERNRQYGSEMVSLMLLLAQSVRYARDACTGKHGCRQRVGAAG